MQITEGKYAARVVNAVLTETSGDDKQPVIEVTVELTGNGLDAPVELSKSYYLSERPDEYNDNKPEWAVSLERLRKLGFAGDDITQLESVIGFVGVAGVKNKVSKKGAAYSVVSWIDRENAQQAKPMESTKAKSFAAQMKAKMQAAGLSSGASAPRPQARAAQPPVRTQPKPKPADDFTAPDETDVPF